MPEPPLQAIKRPVGRPRKYAEGETPEPEKEKKGLFGFGGDKPKKTGSGALTGKEAAELREPFLSALRDDMGYLDKGLWWYSKDASQPQIWSDMADEELEIIANVLLRRAQRDPATAHFVRNVVEMSENMSLLMVVGPRLLKTGQQLGKRPKRARASKATA